ncbi:MAG: hypothetical protein Q7T74_00655 [Candidatus Saccharibacteria bacterium]|nr:hypothetical protein [Candidatus Saccharibacteria bacterium]
MIGEHGAKPEDERDDGTEATPEDGPTEQTEPTVESKDPTLRLMASEYAIFGLSRHAGHAYTGHVHGDEPG